MNTIKYFFLIVSGLFFQRAYSQMKQQKIDSLNRQLGKDSAWIYRPRKVFPLVALDQRNSFLKSSATSDRRVNIWGVKLGITLLDDHNMGIGVYRIQDAYSRISPRSGNQLDQHLQFQYVTSFYEYSIINTRWWQVGIPIEVGYGIYTVNSTIPLKGVVLPQRKGDVFPAGTALDLYFNPTPWLAVNVFGGYRYVFSNESRVDLNGWFYSIGGAVYLHPILESTRYFFTKRSYKRKLKELTT